jgi:hypothetical protein
MNYSSLIFKSAPKWDCVPLAKIEHWHWEGDKPFRPSSFAQLCGVDGKGLYARLWSFEEFPRCVCNKRDEPVYTDSCLELFLQPVPGNDAYVNFEINCKGIYLSEYGKERESRVFIKDFCKLKPVITPFEVIENGKKAWGITIFLSDKLITEIYGNDYKTKPCNIRGNFYKCGDKTPCAHYGAFFPAGSAKLGFHNPARFGSIILK